MVHCGQDAGICIGRGPKIASREMVDHRFDLVGDHGAGHGAGSPGFEIGEQRDRLFAVEGAFDGVATCRDQVTQLGCGLRTFDLEQTHLFDFARHAHQQRDR